MGTQGKNKQTKTRLNRITSIKSLNKQRAKTKNLGRRNVTYRVFTLLLNSSFKNFETHKQESIAHTLEKEVNTNYS